MKRTKLAKNMKYKVETFTTMHWPNSTAMVAFVSSAGLNAVIAQRQLTSNK